MKRRELLKSGLTLSCSLLIPTMASGAQPKDDKGFCGLSKRYGNQPLSSDLVAGCTAGCESPEGTSLWMVSWGKDSIIRIGEAAANE